jgi:rubrerythrin
MTDAIEIAITMEVDAVSFYRECSLRVKNPVGRKMFLSIMEDEKRHIEMLKEVLQGLEITAKDVRPIDAIRSVFEELREVMLKRVEATADEMEAFKVAMEMENEGRDFYRKRAADAAAPKERELFERLAREEEQHYAVFSNTYSFMKDTGNWFMWEEHSIVEG